MSKYSMSVATYKVSLPAREVWIEMIMTIITEYIAVRSLPAREVWIEIL